MPNCRDCQHFSPEKQDCTIGFVADGDCLLRQCVLAILMKHCPKMRGNVLEIGFGMRHHTRKFIPARARWHGIEPRFKSVPEKREFQATVSKMPFADSYFSHVVGTETMEHWPEKGDTLEAGLAEIARVLKPGGQLLLTVPIHLHGDPIFVQGDLPAIRALFSPDVWEPPVMEHWREKFEPCPPPLNIDLAMKKLRQSDRAALASAPGTAWTLEIVTKRK